MGWVVNPTPRLLDPWERYAIPILQEAGWTPGPVRTGAKSLATNGIRSPDRPARSESLCRPNYPVPEWKRREKKMNVSLHKHVFQHMPQMASKTTESIGLTDTFKKSFWRRTYPDKKWEHSSQNCISVVIFPVLFFFCHAFPLLWLAKLSDLSNINRTYRWRDWLVIGK